eukprot:66353_1
MKPLQQKALLNVGTLMLQVYDCILVNNISTWINLCKQIKFDEFILDVMWMYTFGTSNTDELIQPMHNIVSRSEQSSFCWSSTLHYNIEMINDWYIRLLRYESHPPLPKTDIQKDKWILYDWPNAILSHDISCNFQLFDHITLCLEMDVAEYAHRSFAPRFEC